MNAVLTQTRQWNTKPTPDKPSDFYVDLTLLDLATGEFKNYNVPLQFFKDKKIADLVANFSPEDQDIKVLEVETTESYGRLKIADIKDTETVVKLA